MFIRGFHCTGGIKVKKINLCPVCYKTWKTRKWATHWVSLSPYTGERATHPYTEATETSRVGVIDSTPQQGVRMMVYSPKILCLLLFPFCSPSTIHHIGRPLSINRSTERSERKCRHIVTLRKCPSLAIASINTHTMAFATWGPPYSCFFL